MHIYLMVCSCHYSLQENWCCKGDMEDKLEKTEASAMNKDDLIEKLMVSIP
jgi:hypothetical protein